MAGTSPAMTNQHKWNVEADHFRREIGTKSRRVAPV
jgi:hypothetical protein